MGYDVHITCKENWHDEDTTNDIALPEWQAYINSALDFSVENPLTGTAIWRGYSKQELNNGYACFFWHNGNISVKNPDDEILKKMLEIASEFLASVQGDDGEFYTYSSNGGVGTVEVEAGLQRKLRRWKGLWKGFLLILILLVIVFFIYNAVFK